MSINLTDDIEVKTKKGKLGAAKQIFLEGDMQTVENEIKDINSRHSTLSSTVTTQINDNKKQITANKAVQDAKNASLDENMAKLNTRDDQITETLKNIAATGGASVASAVTYDNTTSQLTSANIQGAVDELQGAKVDKTSILQELGESEDKVMSQKTVSNKFSDLIDHSQDITLEVLGFDKLIKFNGTITGTGWGIDKGQHTQISIRKGDTVKVKGTANGCYLAVLNKYGQPSTSNISYAKNEERRVCPAFGEISFTISSDDAKCLAIELNRDDISTKPAEISINGKNLYIPLSDSIDKKSMIGQICPPFTDGSYIDITLTTVSIPENTRINCAGKYFSLNKTTLNREIGAQCEVIYFDIESKTTKITSITSYAQSTNHYALFVVSYDKNKICSLPVTFYTYNGKLFEDKLIDKVHTTKFTHIYLSPIGSKIINQCHYNREKNLSLLWISDIHGDENAVNYAVKFKNNEFNDFLDDCIHTGDSVSGTISDANPFENVSGANSILNVIGNHEAWLSTSDNDYYATEKQTYDKIFKNNIDSWNVTQPSNTVENGKCYYYKDYPDKGYRLIVLDSVHWKVHNDDVTSNVLQKKWLDETLTDAIANSLAVIIATHYPPVNGITFSKGAKGFNSLKYSEQESAIISDGWFSAEEMFSCVDKFIDNGGKFISWLIGHEHSDYIGVVTSHTRQTVILMERSGVNSTSYSNIHLANSHSQIAFNVITFDEENNLLKITRVGNNTDIWLQSKNSICYNYNTHKVIACD